ncbi:DNA topoisomerase IB [Oligoflexus tunisiensis]|uniref:DNA topoisomerase IB n=1 Tax=Oligoflexus tunisiensis TaxID=708132 RepID=UPI00159F33C7|nr:DNA topoisomerase IB [Oligoflexus tunisiensis]
MPTKAARCLKKLSPEDEANLAGLRYLPPSVAGYTRRKMGKNFCYVDMKGRLVKCPKLKKRFQALMIPPAWKDVWISPDARSHIQATGFDEKGRKQYRYHPGWRAQRDGSKFHRILQFADMLPGLRRKIQENLRAPALSKPQIVATIVQLLETTLIRIGNESYAQQNKSYGLTTIRTQHVEISNSRVTFTFKGKSGVPHNVELRDARMARIIARCHDLPGQILFQYLDEKGQPHPIGSADVNAFLRETTGGAFTAKDFRTWTASVMAARVLRDYDPPTSLTSSRRNIKAAISEVARALRNTVSICRKCYVHPQVITAYMDGQLDRSCADRYERLASSFVKKGFRDDEAFFLALLQSCSKRKAQAA